MWWQIVFWILLVPLIVIEIIVFLKSRKFYWLVFSLAIFAYVMAVSYAIDVFSLGRNTVLLILLASALLMFFVGKQLGRNVKKQRVIPASLRNLAIGCAAFIVILFVVSVIFGKASDTTTPVASVKASDIIIPFNENGNPKPMMQPGVAVLERTLTNSFILPIPVVSKTYRMCLVTTTQVTELYGPGQYVDQYDEVGPGQTQTFSVYTSQYTSQKGEQVTPTEILVYDTTSPTSTNRYPSCAELGTPLYRIPVV